MNPSTIVKVSVRDGTPGLIDITKWPLDGSKREACVEFPDGRRTMVSVASLRRQGEGYVVDDRAAEATTESHKGEGRLVVPVVEEQIEVGKRVVEAGGVRLTRNVEEREEIIEQALARHDVEVERVPVNRELDAPLSARNEGEVLIIPVMEEVVVVTKKLMLREEIHVRPRRTERKHQERVTVRRQDVHIEAVEKPGSGQ